MAVVSYRSIAEGIYETLKGKSPAEQKALLPRVINFLARHNLISKSEEILSRLSETIDKAEGRITAKVYSRLPLDQATKTKIREKLKEKYEAGDVALDEKLDERLLGGFRIEIRDEVIDLSVRNKIRKLQEHLMKGA